MSCSVSSSHTRTCIAFPSLHQWNISSIVVIPHKSRKCETVNLVFVCYDNILKIHSQSRGYAMENSCNDKFAVTWLLDWNTSTNHHMIHKAKTNTNFIDSENITQFKTVLKQNLYMTSTRTFLNFTSFPTLLRFLFHAILTTTH